MSQRILISPVLRVEVRKAPQMALDSSGKPTMMFGMGGEQGKRNLGGRLGGAIGAIGGALGPHRSLGGMLGGMQAGHAMGGAMGQGAGSKIGNMRRRVVSGADAATRYGKRMKISNKDRQAELAGRNVERGRRANAAQLPIEQKRVLLGKPTLRESVPVPQTKPERLLSANVPTHAPETLALPENNRVKVEKPVESKSVNLPPKVPVAPPVFIPPDGRPFNQHRKEEENSNAITRHHLDGNQQMEVPPNLEIESQENSQINNGTPNSVPVNPLTPMVPAEETREKQMGVLVAQREEQEKLEAQQAEQTGVGL